MLRISTRGIVLAAAVGVLGTAIVAVGTAADAVILNDGFVLKGKVFKERGVQGRYSFDAVDDGPKVIIYSAHSRKGGKVEKDIPDRDLTAYKRDYPRVQLLRAPAVGEFEASEFDENWRRTMTVRRPDGNFHDVKQLITYLDPNSCFVASTTHNWRVAYHTAEMDPEQIITLLRNHPDLKEEDGQPDPAKRMAIVTFLKDTGWLLAAREEFDAGRETRSPAVAGRPRRAGRHAPQGTRHGRDQAGH